MYARAQARAQACIHFRCTRSGQAVHQCTRSVQACAHAVHKLGTCLGTCVHFQAVSKLRHSNFYSSGDACEALIFETWHEKWPNTTLPTTHTLTLAYTLPSLGDTMPLSLQQVTLVPPSTSPTLYSFSPVWIKICGELFTIFSHHSASLSPSALSSPLPAILYWLVILATSWTESTSHTFPFMLPHSFFLRSSFSPSFSQSLPSPPPFFLPPLPSQGGSIMLCLSILGVWHSCWVIPRHSSCLHHTRCWWRTVSGRWWGERQKATRTEQYL